MIYVFIFVCFIPVVSDSFLQIYKIKKEKSIPCFRFEAEYIGNGGWHQYLFLHCYYLRSCSSMICTYFSGVAPTSTIGLPPTGMKNKSRQRLYSEMFAQVFLFIRIHFIEYMTFPLYFSANSSIFGSKSHARAAPSCPKVNNHRFVSIINEIISCPVIKNMFQKELAGNRIQSCRLPL